MATIRAAGICPTHGFYKGSHCPKNHVKRTAKVNVPGEWVRNTVFEHIDPTNDKMRFDSPKELAAACESRGLMAKGLMKPKSQGRGSEQRRVR